MPKPLALPQDVRPSVLLCPCSYPSPYQCLCLCHPHVFLYPPSFLKTLYSSLKFFSPKYESAASTTAPQKLHPFSDLGDQKPQIWARSSVDQSLVWGVFQKLFQRHVFQRHSKKDCLLFVFPTTEQLFCIPSGLARMLRPLPALIAVTHTDNDQQQHVSLSTDQQQQQRKQCFFAEMCRILGFSLPVSHDAESQILRGKRKKSLACFLFITNDYYYKSTARPCLKLIPAFP